MKSLIYIAIVFLLIVGCHSQKNISDQDKSKVAMNDTVRIANDSLHYEVIIIDAGFYGWLHGHAYPRQYHSQFFLESKNRIYVTEWNYRVRNPLRYNADLYDLEINYDPMVNYGYEVNYLIYNYLVYFQNKYNQRLNGYVPNR